jgi:hypothetical protein
MENITLSTQLVNAVMGYLGTRPYQEVFQLIGALQDEAKKHLQTSVEEPKATE